MPPLVDLHKDEVASPRASEHDSTTPAAECLPRLLEPAGNARKPDEGPPAGKAQVIVNGKRVSIDQHLLDTIPADVLRELDEDGDGHISFEEIVKAAMERSKRHKQVGRMRKMIGGLVVAVLAVVSLNTIATIISVEASKESKVKGAQMVSLEGEPVRVSSTDMGLADGRLCSRDAEGACTNATVKTGEMRSYATLFDLPMFDSATLAALREVTVTLENGDELTVTVTGARKHAFAQACTLDTASGNHILIDAKSGVAIAKLGGEEHFIRDDGGERRLRESQDWRPRLYSEREIFHQDERGRRLQKMKQNIAALALSVGFEATSMLEDLVGNLATVNSHAVIRGWLHVGRIGMNRQLGKKEVFYMTMLFNKVDVKKSRIHVEQDEKAWLAVYGLNREFEFENGELQTCARIQAPELGDMVSHVVHSFRGGSRLVVADGNFAVRLDMNDWVADYRESQSFEADVDLTLEQYSMLDPPQDWEESDCKARSKTDEVFFG